MTLFDVLLAIFWTAMIVVASLMVIYRQPVAYWLRPRMRYWKNRPDAQSLYERSMLFGGIGIGVFSAIALFGAVVVLPRLEHALVEVDSATADASGAPLGPAI